jgi:hypothetical protein
MELLEESSVYLFAILALLGLWLFHQLQVRSGRIQAIDVFDRSLERFYLFVLPEGRPSCPACQQAQGRVFLPSVAGKVGFSPLEGVCGGAVPCQGVLVGLYGSWAEARDLVSRLQRSPRKRPLRLSSDEILSLVKGAWRKSISADSDRVSMHVLEGWCFTATDDLAAAIEGLRYVVDRAKETRHLSYVVPASLRLMELLLKAGRDDEARTAIEQFEVRFPPDRHEFEGPTFAQRAVLKDMKSRLWKTQSLKVSA